MKFLKDIYITIFLVSLRNSVLICCSCILLLSCSKDGDDVGNNPPQNNIIHEIPPFQIDRDYSILNPKHYVVRNKTLHLEKLVVLLGGTRTNPKEYQVLCKHLASLGYDVISLSYRNNFSTLDLNNSPNIADFDFYREEVCFGTPVSTFVDVDEKNSIVTRTYKLLEYLSANYPSENWEDYIDTESETIRWNFVILSGHSQGSGHAHYLAKKKQADRLVMFAGPNDFNIRFQRPANWLQISGLTPMNKQFALLHEKDEVASYANQILNLRAASLLQNGEVPTNVDNISAPYANKRILSVKMQGISNHGALVGNNPKLPAIWTYLFQS